MSLGDILQLQYGKPLDDTDRKSNGAYPIYGANGEKGRSDLFLVDRPSIIVGRKGSAGAINLTEDKFWPLDVAYFVTFDDRQHDLRFLYRLLESLDLAGMAKGVKPGINRNEVYARRVRVPALPEQRRIAGILEETFEAIATAKANAEKNLGNAHAVFERHSDAVFSGGHLHSKASLLSDLASFRNGINYTQGGKGESVKIVGVRNFQANFNAPLEGLDSVRINGQLSETDLLRPDDILAVRSNGNIELIGRCMLVGEVRERISHSGFTIRIRLESHDVSARYLCYFLRAASTRARLTDGGTGTNIKSLNQGTLGALRIPLVSLTEQKKIVDTLDRISDESYRLESLYKQKLAALNALKKSLLHEAFSGNL